MNLHLEQSVQCTLTEEDVYNGFIVYLLLFPVVLYFTDLGILQLIKDRVLTLPQPWLK